MAPILVSGLLYLIIRAFVFDRIISPDNPNYWGYSLAYFMFHIIACISLVEWLDL